MSGNARSGLLLLVLLALFAPLRTNHSACFRRGDVDSDGSRNVTDAITILGHLFGGRAAISCRDAGDVNDDGKISISDGVFLLQHLFGSQRFRVLPPPLEFCGRDPTEDALGCEQSSGCSGVYGLDIDADAVFFVVDRSGSMLDSGELSIAKRAMACAIDDLADDEHFGIIFSDQGTLVFPADGTPAIASEETKRESIAWLDTVGAGAGSCPREGLLRGLTMANAAVATNRALVYIGDGGGTCGGQNETDYLNETLAAVTEANTNEVVIHTIGVLEVGQIQQKFLEDLAAQNGGQFLLVEF